MNFLFLIPLILSYAYVASIGTTVHNGRYKKRMILSLIMLLFGILFEILTNENKRFSYIILGLLPTVFMLCYKLVSSLLKPFIGHYPYFPHREKIGTKVMGSGYPKNRKVKLVDYVFGIILLFLPIIIIILLGLLFNRYF